MKISTTYPASHTGLPTIVFHKPGIFNPIAGWIRRREPVWEENRLGISVTGIFIQATFAAVMISVLGIAGAPVWVFTTGIFFAFMADSLSFAQCSMKIVIGGFLASLLINISFTLFYAIQLACA